MNAPRKSIVVALGALVAIASAAVSQSLGQAPAGARGAETLVVDSATVDWIEFSNVAALIDGNVESIELELGRTVKKDGIIGRLYQKKAELMVKKAQVAASGIGAINKAEAQRKQALSVVARNDALMRRDRLLVPKEDQEKALADVDYTVSSKKEAEENRDLAVAELELAKNALDEHTIRAPFSGVIVKRIKGPGESVRANEPVVQLGNLDRLRVFAFLPLEYVTRVVEGTIVEFQPRIEGTRASTQPIEQKRFRGKISFVDPQVAATTRETEFRIYADFENESHELKPGFKGVLTVYLNPAGLAAAPRPTQAAQVPAPAVGGVDLPQLPR